MYLPRIAPSVGIAIFELGPSAKKTPKDINPILMLYAKQKRLIHTCRLSYMVMAGQKVKVATHNIDTTGSIRTIKQHVL